MVRWACRRILRSPGCTAMRGSRVSTTGPTKCIGWSCRGESLASSRRAANGTSAGESLATEKRTDLRFRELLERVDAALPGANSHHLFHWHDKDLAVADSAGPRRALDRFDHL